MSSRRLPGLKEGNEFKSVMIYMNIYSRSGTPLVGQTELFPSNFESQSKTRSSAWTISFCFSLVSSHLIWKYVFWSQDSVFVFDIENDDRTSIDKLQEMSKSKERKQNVSCFFNMPVFWYKILFYLLCLAKFNSLYN